MQQYEKDHLALVVKQEAECTVLLKTNGKFPIEEPGQIACFGAGIRYTIKGGTGSGEVNSRFSQTIEEGLTKYGFSVTSGEWLDAYDAIRVQAKKDFKKQIIAEAKAKKQNVMMYVMGKDMPEPNHDLTLAGEGDTAIYVVSRKSGEGGDRQAIEGDVKLTQSEVRDILALDQMYDKFMLVLNVGGVVDLTPVAEVGNILVMSQLGVMSGHVLGDILTGKQNPSGKLTTTWAAWEDYSSEGTFGDENETLYKEGIYVGYRYFDSFGKKPLFPFGYGLSYTTFTNECTEVSIEADTVTVKALVTNTGSCVGKEVIQVYVSAPAGKLDKAYQDLTAFAKTGKLAPGASQELTMTFKLSDIASYDEETASYILEKGDYIVRVGNSSVDTKIAAVITLDENAVVLTARNCLGTPSFEDLKAPARAAEEIPAEAVRLSVSAAEIISEAVVYDVEYPVDLRIAALTDEELAYMNVGSFNPKGGALSVIGDASHQLAGAAGETTSALADKGIGALVMADGPAGLRVAKKYYEDKDGAHDASGKGMLPESMTEYMPGILQFALKLVSGAKKPPKGAEIKEHYATMIPIGTAIAQSFNYDLAKSYGEMVGSEMEMMNVQLWLAPALNIHRSILCGRNFEYYSEDPLVSGLFAAAITEGVQSHPTCGTTIKHYAANNQEINRYANNSQVSERAMREIYLRGFGICVRKSQPHSVMTSYNLLNGIHTSEHRGLTEDVLRNEFGFQGIVMTDWVIGALTASKGNTYRLAYSDETAKAGGDLFMPGCKGDYDRVLAAIKGDTQVRKQVEINATRVLNMVEKLGK